MGTTTHSARNSLIELYRFLFAIWVFYYHEHLFDEHLSFAHGYLAVEFFFILSGYYLIKSLNKYKNQPYFKGLCNFLWKRFLPLALPFVISIIFVVWYNYTDFPSHYTFFGYMWYIPVMFASFIVFFTLKRYIKSERNFIITVLILSILSFALNYTICIDWGIFRGLGAMGLGILLSYIKPKTFRYKDKNLNAFIMFFAIISTILLASIPKHGIWVDFVLIFAAFPALIYFTNTIKFENTFFNYLGSLSFGVYAYQCIIRVINYYTPLDTIYNFIILLLIVLTMHYLTYLIEYFKIKKAVLIYSPKINSNNKK